MHQCLVQQLLMSLVDSEGVGMLQGLTGHAWHHAVLYSVPSPCTELLHVMRTV